MTSFNNFNNKQTKNRLFLNKFLYGKQNTQELNKLIIYDHRLQTDVSLRKEK